MTLAKIIDTLKMIALKHPNVNSAYEGNIYDILNAKPDNRYASVVITQQSHTTDEIYDHYGFVIFYVDRLVDDMEENRVQIQSIGKSMLGNIITAFCNEFEAECENISYQPFTQRFADETAGVYCTITIDTVKDVYCAERYWDESWSAPIISIKNVDMSITFTDNGHYTLDYDPTNYTGIGKVDIDVNVDVDSYYNRGYGVGYDQGKVDGVSEQKSKLETISITENGVYSNEDGYNHIEVNVPDLNGSYEEGYNNGYNNGYENGYDGGKQEVMESAQDITITENGQYGDGETLYKTINVDVVPKVNIAKANIKFGNSSFTELPEWADFYGVTDLTNMFLECSNLKRIPAIDTSQVTAMSYTFKNCYTLETLPLLDTSKVTFMQNTFWRCDKLTTIPPIDTSSVIEMQNAFYACESLTSLPALNAQSMNMTYGGIFGSYELPKLINFGGFINLKSSLTDDKNLKKLPNLTYESCINILNGLYDFTGNGETPNSSQGQLKVHQNFLDKVGDEISIGTAKGWVISA